MLEGIFGNRTAERGLLHIYHNGETYASAVALDYGLAIDPIKKQLERFELASVLVAKQVGRTRVYSFNPKSPFVKPVQQLIKIAYESIPLREREKIFAARRRPRRRGKPI